MSEEQHTQGATDLPTPDALREGVRSAVSAALVRDIEHRGGRTGGQLVLSGVLGVAGGLAVTWLVAAHPLDHHPRWHLAFYSTLWTGLLIVALALAMLDVRTPRWPIATAARAAVLALGIAGVCGWCCSDQHFLGWWSMTTLGSWIARTTGSAGLNAFCFGSVATIVFALVAALPTLPRRTGAGRRLPITAAFIALLMAPGIALQSTGTSLAVFAAWMGGTVVGALGGVAVAIALVTRRRPLR